MGLATLTPAPRVCQLPETIRRDQQHPPISTEGPKAALLHPLMSPRFLPAQQQHIHIHTHSLMCTLTRAAHNEDTFSQAPLAPASSHRPASARLERAGSPAELAAGPVVPPVPDPPAWGDPGALCLGAPPKPGPQKNAGDRLSDVNASGRLGAGSREKKHVCVSPEEPKGDAPSWSAARDSMS